MWLLLLLVVAGAQDDQTCCTGTSDLCGIIHNQDSCDSKAVCYWTCSDVPAPQPPPTNPIENEPRATRPPVAEPVVTQTELPTRASTYPPPHGGRTPPPGKGVPTIPTARPTEPPMPCFNDTSCADGYWCKTVCRYSASPPDSFVGVEGDECICEEVKVGEFCEPYLQENEACNFVKTIPPKERPDCQNELKLCGFKDSEQLICQGTSSSMKEGTCQLPACPNVTTFTTLEGRITDGSDAVTRSSEFGPEVHYRTNTRCRWLIDPEDATPTSKIQIIIIRMHTEACIAQCDGELDEDGLYTTIDPLCCDYVNVYDGGDNTAPLLVSLQGVILPSPVITNSPRAYIEFITDESNNDDGFELYYRTIEEEHDAAVAPTGCHDLDDIIYADPVDEVATCDDFQCRELTTTCKRTAYGGILDVMLEPGVYLLETPWPEDSFREFDEGILSEDCGFKHIRIRSMSGNASDTVIDCAGHSCVNTNVSAPGLTLTFMDLTIKNGFGINSSGLGNFEKQTLILRNVVIQNMSSMVSGGAISAQDSKVIICNSQIHDVSSSESGGFLDMKSNRPVEERYKIVRRLAEPVEERYKIVRQLAEHYQTPEFIQDYYATDFEELPILTTLVIEDSVFSNANTDGNGGVLNLDNVNARITGSKFVSTSAQFDGGAISYVGMDSDLEVSGCLFQNSSAPFGGAIYYHDNIGTGAEGALDRVSDRVTVSDSLFLGCGFDGSSDANYSTSSRGGGMSISSGTSDGDVIPLVVSLQNLTFEGCITDESGFGGGLYLENIHINAADLQFQSSESGDGGAIYMKNAFTRKFANINIVDTIGSALYLSGSGTDVNAVGLEDVTITGCKAIDGGCIFLLDSNVDLTDVHVSDGVSKVRGGCVFSSFSRMYWKGGSVSRCKSDISGGGLHIQDTREGEETQLHNISITECSAEFGGGIYIIFGDVVISDSKIAENFAFGDGGGFYVDTNARLKLINVISEGNSASRGGALFSRKTEVEVESSSFHENKADDGPIAYLFGAILQWTTSGAIRNVAENYGGVYCDSGGSANIDGGSFEENEGVNGGALSIVSCSFSIRHTNFSRNLALDGGRGGAVFVGKASYLNITDSNFQNNTANTFGGALAFEDANSEDTDSPPIPVPAQIGPIPVPTQDGAAPVPAPASAVQTNIPTNVPVPIPTAVPSSFAPVPDPSQVQVPYPHNVPTPELLVVPVLPPGGDQGTNETMHSYRHRVIDSHIVANSADNGGGVYIDRKNGLEIDFRDTEIAHNSANGGGGVYFYGTPDEFIDKRSIKDNTALYGDNLATEASHLELDDLSISYLKGSGSSTWKSGEIFEKEFNILIMDNYDQRLASDNKTRIVVKERCAECEIVGPANCIAEKGKCKMEFGIRARPNEDVKFIFETETVYSSGQPARSDPYSIHLGLCAAGEEVVYANPERTMQKCQECPSQHYSDGIQCELCPENSITEDKKSCICDAEFYMITADHYAKLTDDYAKEDGIWNCTDDTSKCSPYPFRCLDCPPGGDCTKGSTFVNLVALVDYWAVETLPNDIERSFVKCLQTGACINQDVDHICEKGYNGILCAQCEPKYTKFTGQECIPCLDEDAAIVVWVIIILFGIAYIVLQIISHVKQVQRSFDVQEYLIANFTGVSTSPPENKFHIAALGVHVDENFRILKIDDDGPAYREGVPRYYKFEKIIDVAQNQVMEHPRSVEEIQDTILKYSDKEGAINVHFSDQTSGRGVLLRILTSHIQLIAIIKNFELLYPQFLMRWFQVNEGSVSTKLVVTHIDCFLSPGSHPAVWRKSFYICLPIILMCVVALLMLIRYVHLLCRNEEAAKEFRANFRDYFVASSIVIIFTLYPGLVMRTFELWNCVPVGSVDFLRDDTSIVCGTSEYYAFALGLGIPSALVWVVGCPVYLSIVIMRLSSHQTHLLEVRIRYWFVLKGYLKKFQAWEIVVSFRKVFVVATAVFLSSRILVQSQVALLVVIIAICLQLSFMPYRERHLNILEFLGLTTSFLTIYLGQFLNMGEDITDRDRTGISSMILIFNLVFIIIVLFHLARSVSAVSKVIDSCSCLPCCKKSVQPVQYDSSLAFPGVSLDPNYAEDFRRARDEKTKEQKTKEQKTGDQDTKPDPYAPAGHTGQQYGAAGDGVRFEEHARPSEIQLTDVSRADAEVGSDPGDTHHSLQALHFTESGTEQRPLA